MTACKQENNDGNDIYIINKYNSVKSSLSLLFSICQVIPACLMKQYAGFGAMQLFKWLNALYI